MTNSINMYILTTVIFDVFHNSNSEYGTKTTAKRELYSGPKVLSLLQVFLEQRMSLNRRLKLRK